MLLQIGAVLKTRAAVITKYGSYYNLGQKLFQIGAGLQIWAVITNLDITPSMSTV